MFGEAYRDGLIGHFGVAITLYMIHEHFYWPKKKIKVQRICDRCIVC